MDLSVLGALGPIVAVTLIYVLGFLVAYGILRAAVAHGVYDALERHDRKVKLDETKAQIEETLREPTQR